MTYQMGFSNMDYVCPTLVEGVSQYATTEIPEGKSLEEIKQPQEKKFPWWLLLLVGGVAYYASRGDAV